MRGDEFYFILCNKQQQTLEWGRWISEKYFEIASELEHFNNLNAEIMEMS